MDPKPPANPQDPGTSDLQRGQNFRIEDSAARITARLEEIQRELEELKGVDTDPDKYQEEIDKIEREKEAELQNPDLTEEDYTEAGKQAGWTPEEIREEIRTREKDLREMAILSLQYLQGNLRVWEYLAMPQYSRPYADLVMDEDEKKVAADREASTWRPLFDHIVDKYEKIKLEIMEKVGEKNRLLQERERLEEEYGRIVAPKLAEARGRDEAVATEEPVGTFETPSWLEEPETRPLGFVIPPSDAPAPTPPAERNWWDEPGLHEYAPKPETQSTEEGLGSSGENLETVIFTKRGLEEEITRNIQPILDKNSATLETPITVTRELGGNDLIVEIRVTAPGLMWGDYHLSVYFTITNIGNSIKVGATTYGGDQVAVDRAKPGIEERLKQFVPELIAILEKKNKNKKVENLNIVDGELSVTLSSKQEGQTIAAAIQTQKEKRNAFYDKLYNADNPDYVTSKIETREEIKGRENQAERERKIAVLKDTIARTRKIMADVEAEAKKDGEEEWSDERTRRDLLARLEEIRADRGRGN